MLNAPTVDVYGTLKGTLKATSGVKVGSTTTCNLAAAGTIRYTTASCACGQKRVAAQMCMESGASAFSWTDLASRSFADDRCGGC
ncbi:MAG: hypothetical protein CMH52_06525 [Myxococcales bacterium]|nr:hypothetical protein [Myxococcales bacterium]